MKIWEIDFKINGIKFEDDDKNVWTTLNGDIVDEHKRPISDTYTLLVILLLDFTEVIDWSKVAVDTPVWVWREKKENCVKRHFSNYKDNLYLCFYDGTTSHTSFSSSPLTNWEYCSLTDPNKGE